jgi:hypothetical protein
MEGYELGDFDVLTSLRGCIPERFSIASEKTTIKSFSKFFIRSATSLKSAKNEQSKKGSSNMLDKLEKKLPRHESYCIFAKRKADENRPELSYRVGDAKFCIDGSVNTMYVKLRLYISSGYKKINHYKEKDEPQYLSDDVWMKVSEFCQHFRLIN